MNKAGLRLAKLRRWLEATDLEANRVAKKTVLVDLTAEAKAKLLRQKRNTGQ